jgi:hypothetical protein
VRNRLPKFAFSQIHLVHPLRLGIDTNASFLDSKKGAARLPQMSAHDAAALAGAGRHGGGRPPAAPPGAAPAAASGRGGALQVESS